MCLRKLGDDSIEDRYVYARVLGVYHVNVVYNGPGSLDLNPRRINFLWVRWFESENADGNAFSLNRLSLPTVSASSESLDFLNPEDVLRACHIIPRFYLGRKHVEEKHISSVIAESDSELDDLGPPETPESDRQSHRKRVRSDRLEDQPLRGAATRCFLSTLAQEDEDWKEYYVNR